MFSTGRDQAGYGKKLHWIQNLNGTSSFSWNLWQIWTDHCYLLRWECFKIKMSLQIRITKNIILQWPRLISFKLLEAIFLANFQPRGKTVPIYGIRHLMAFPNWSSPASVQKMLCCGSARNHNEASANIRTNSNNRRLKNDEKWRFLFPVSFITTFIRLFSMFSVVWWYLASLFESCQGLWSKTACLRENLY